MGNSKSAHHSRHFVWADKYRNPKRMINCMVVGDDASGRDSLIMRYLSNELQPKESVYGYPVFDEQVCYSMIAHQRLYNIKLYNVPENFAERQQQGERHNYPMPDVIILTYSLVKSSTRDNLVNKWYPLCRKMMGRHAHRIPVILVGVFSDLRDDLEQQGDKYFDADGQEMTPTGFSEGVQLGNQFNATAYVEASLETGLGVEQAFYEAAHATKKYVPLEVGVKDKSVCHRHSIALKRYDFHRQYLVSHKLFLHNYVPHYV